MLDASTPNRNSSVGEISRTIDMLRRAVAKQKIDIHRAVSERELVQAEADRLAALFEKVKADLAKKTVEIRRLEGDRDRSNRELDGLERELSERNRLSGGTHRNL